LNRGHAQVHDWTWEGGEVSNRSSLNSTRKGGAKEEKEEPGESLSVGPNSEVRRGNHHISSQDKRSTSITKMWFLPTRWLGSTEEGECKFNGCEREREA